MGTSVSPCHQVKFPKQVNDGQKLQVKQLFEVGRCRLTPV